VKSTEGKRIETMIEPLSPAERKLALRLLGSVVAFVHEHGASRSRKRSA
jgi:hypothetical protein